MPGVQVYGTDEAVAALERIDVITREAVTEITKRAAVDTATLAKRLCPVDTGRLRSSIEHREFREGGQAVAEVYTGVEYAEYVEYGTVNMQAEPFLGPAWDAIRPHYLADLVAALREAGYVP